MAATRPLPAKYLGITTRLRSGGRFQTMCTTPSVYSQLLAERFLGYLKNGTRVYYNNINPRENTLGIHPRLPRSIHALVHQFERPVSTLIRIGTKRLGNSLTQNILELSTSFTGSICFLSRQACYRVCTRFLAGFSTPSQWSLKHTLSRQDLAKWIVSRLERGDLCIQAWRSVIRTPSRNGQSAYIRSQRIRVQYGAVV